MTIGRTFSGQPFGRWWRAEAYEIVDDYVRPVPGAGMQPFDIWEALEGASERPYELLSRVIRRGRYTVDQSLTSETKRDLVTWCRHYGLLGTLLQQVQTVIFPVATEAGRSEEGPRVTQVSLHRTSRGWQLQSRTTDESSAARWVQSPVVIRQAISSVQMTAEPISETWARFFPGISMDSREHYEYLHPRERSFWEFYQEPVRDFLGAAYSFAEVLMTIAKGPETKRGVSALDDYTLAFHDLNGFAEPAHWIVEPAIDGLQERWVTPTLLAGLSMLALRDLRRGRQLRICTNETCQNLFGSTRYQSLYCSRRCRLTVNKRTLRRSQREKAERTAASKRGRSKRTRGPRDKENQGRKAS